MTTKSLSERLREDIEAQDWENACHEFLWEKQENLFLAIQRRAIDLFAERMKSQNTFSTSDPDDPIF